MSREIEIKDTIFIVNTYSSTDATETLVDMLQRVVIRNAKAEFKKSNFSDGFFCNDVYSECFDFIEKEGDSGGII